MGLFYCSGSRTIRLRPLLPSFTGVRLTPKSPGCAMAWPLLEIRTFTVTSVMLESLAAGFMAVLSSKTKSKGNLSAVVLTIASGMREPDTGVAKTNTVSVGATLSASSLITLTLPVIRAVLAWLLEAPAELLLTEAPLLAEFVLG